MIQVRGGSMAEKGWGGSIKRILHETTTVKFITCKLLKKEIIFMDQGCMPHEIVKKQTNKQK